MRKRWEWNPSRAITVLSNVLFGSPGPCRTIGRAQDKAEGVGSVDNLWSLFVQVSLHEQILKFSSAGLCWTRNSGMQKLSGSLGLIARALSNAGKFLLETWLGVGYGAKKLRDRAESTPLLRFQPAAPGIEELQWFRTAGVMLSATQEQSFCFSWPQKK